LQGRDEAGGESVGVGVGAETSAVLHPAEPVSQQLFPSLERGRERHTGFVVVVGDFGGDGPENAGRRRTNAGSPPVLSNADEGGRASSFGVVPNPRLTGR
jgi:hypothetical protein